MHKLLTHSLLLCVACLHLNGCSPPENTLSGQVFIVTRGSENIKMGLVEVFLIPQGEVDNHLRTKQKEWDAKIEGLRAEVIAAQSNSDLARLQFLQMSQFDSTNAPAKVTYAAYLSDLKVIKDSTVELNSLSAKLEASKWNRNMSEADSEELWVQTKAKTEIIGSQIYRPALERIERYEKASDEQGERMQEAINAAEQRLTVKKMQLAVIAPDDSLLATNSDLTFSSHSDLRADKSNFFSDSLPPFVCATTFTDADGKFSFKYPARGRFAIFARAIRQVGEAKENYAWFFWLPENEKEPRVLLSNNNVVSSDSPGNILSAIFKPVPTDKTHSAR